MQPGTVQAKNYVDREIQTEVQDQSVPGLADTHSLATLIEPSVAFHLRLSPSTSVSRHTSSRPQLLYNRPIEPHALAKRIVSLPESPFGTPCNLRATHDSAGMRIVSLPETMRCSPQSTDNASCLDSFGTSVDTSLDISSGNHRKSRTKSNLDIPRTPSPPSSPDSILIIDNDVHLPNLFLYGHKNTVIEDDEGAYP
jgi:hypothetical protein